MSHDRREAERADLRFQGGRLGDGRRLGRRGFLLGFASSVLRYYGDERLNVYLRMADSRIDAALRCALTDVSTDTGYLAIEKWLRLGATGYKYTLGRYAGSTMTMYAADRCAMRLI